MQAMNKNTFFFICCYFYFYFFRKIGSVGDENIRFLLGSNLIVYRSMLCRAESKQSCNLLSMNGHAILRERFISHWKTYNKTTYTFHYVLSISKLFNGL